MDNANRHPRLEAALADTNASAEDLAPLLRQHGTGELPASLHPGVSLDRLRHHGVVMSDRRTVARIDTASFGWLAGPHDAISEATAAQRREPWWRPFPADPAVEAGTGFTDYRGAGQKSAVRAALRMPAGEVMAVILPTGTGKSLVGLVRAFTGDGTTVVVVPTVALAIDQEQLLAARRQHPSLPSDVRDRLDALPAQLAYHSKVDPEIRAVMRDRLAAGTQRLIFCSPEAAVGSLAHALNELARRGQLDTLVVDECHVVDTWGESFRPEFQLLPALRRRLVRTATEHHVSPPATILLSATVTDGTLGVLERLFHLPREHVIDVTHLRPEPRFLLARPTHEQERREQLGELLSVAPRPAIVYVTKPDDAEALADDLRERGFTRVSTFHGRTSDRSEALQSWAGVAPATDVMVATSAFGLGINVPDVRTVVHACLPESIDRYYQEVGRGGRDMAPSLSILMPLIADGGTADIEVASSLARRKVIGDVLAANRWRSMRRAATIGADGSVTIDTRTVPVREDGVPTDVTLRSDRNTEWNWATLGLMTRARAIELETVAPTTPPPDIDEVEHFAWQRSAAVVISTASTPPHVGSWDRLLAAFSEAVSPARPPAQGALPPGVADMLEIASGAACTSEAIRKEYERRIETRTGLAREAPLGTCNGCPACGSTVSSQHGYDPVPRTRLFPIEPGALLRERAGHGPLLIPIRSERRDRREDLSAVARWAYGQNVRHITLRGGTADGLHLKELWRGLGVQQRLTVTVDHGDMQPPPVPRLLVLLDGEVWPSALSNLSKVPTVLLHDIDALDPRAAGRALCLTDTTPFLRPDELPES